MKTAICHFILKKNRYQTFKKSQNSYLNLLLKIGAHILDIGHWIQKLD